MVVVVGFFAAGSAEKILNQKDPGPIVIDEIAGMLITLIAAPPYIWVWVLGFFIFRFFDIAKPFPIRWIDANLNGGAGIMLDDVMAGIYSFLVLQALLLFL
jgi:phosphatidylglycerophosphatase A